MNCFNCNEALKENAKYCSNCGQKHIKNISLSFVLKDFIKDYFSVDSKIFSTIRFLLFYPGKLSSEYMEGKRKSFLPPIRLYLFVSILYFFVLNIPPIYDKSNVDDSNFNFSFNSGSSADSTLKANSFYSWDMNGINHYLSEEQFQDLKVDKNWRAYMDSTGLNAKTADAWIETKLLKSQLEGGDFDDSMMQSLSVFMFLFIPFIAFIFRVTFWRNKYRYLHHLIFNVHLHTFLFTILLLEQLLSIFIRFDYGLIGAIGIITVYAFFGMRRFYKRNVVVSLYKTLFMTLAYLIMGILFMMLTLFYSLAFSV